MLQLSTAGLINPYKSVTSSTALSGLLTVVAYAEIMSSEYANANKDVASGAPRQESRDNIFLTAELRFDGASESFTARIRNISTGGMMVDCPANFPIGHKVTAKLRNVGEVTGRIAWAVLPRIGIAFDGEVDPKKVRYAPEAPASTSYAPAYLKEAGTSRRPGLGRI